MIGNAKNVPLFHLLTHDDWRKHPVIRTLVEKGPFALMSLPESEGFEFHEEKYIDTCHLCCDLRKGMQKTYPED